jgi:hypothetical protein
MFTGIMEEIDKTKVFIDLFNKMRKDKKTATDTYG